MQPGIFSSLTREQKEAIGLLQIGTFLEYYDLMLYVHMAVLLNELFFPKTDPHTESLLIAFAFSSTYMLRPFGALLFGWIGDHYGRKPVLIITMMLMTVSCIVMAYMPTYAEIGITASWVITICRIVQGISSMGEIVGAEIYLTEITKPPYSYQIVSMISCASRLGTIFALAVSTAVITIGIDWRVSFLIGTLLSTVGSFSRAYLAESSTFIQSIGEASFRKTLSREAQKRRRKKLLRLNLRYKTFYKTVIACFLIYCGPPACLYFSYMYFSIFLKQQGFSNEFLIKQNLYLSIIEFAAMVGVIILSRRMHPLNLIRNRASIYLLLIIVFPLFLEASDNYSCIFTIQSLSVIFTLTGIPAVSIFISYFPVLKRFTYVGFIYALSRAVVYFITSFGLAYFNESIGHVGASFILIPITIGFLWSVRHFQKLERRRENSVKILTQKI